MSEVKVITFEDCGLTDDELTYVNNNIQTFNDYMNKLKNYSCMDIDMEIKSNNNAINNLQKSLFNANGCIKLSDEMVKTELMMEGYTQNQINEDKLLPFKSNTYDREYVSKIKKSKVEIEDKLTCVTIFLKISNTMRDCLYGDICIGEVDKLIDKLNNDIRMLENSSDINRDLTIKNIKSSIELIEDLSDDFLIKSFPADKRAKKIYKELNVDLINRIFNENIVYDFEARLLIDGVCVAYHDCILLFLYHLSKKVQSSMKSKDYKSLVYRSYIVSYLSDTKPGSDLAIKKASVFNQIFDNYVENGIIK